MTRQPSPEEAAAALELVRQQRLRLATGLAAPRWLSILLLGGAATAAVSAGLAQDLLDGTAKLVAVVTGMTVLCVVLVVLASVSRGIGARTFGFGAVAAPTAEQKRRNITRVVALLVPAVVITSWLPEAFDLPLPRTCVVVFWVFYAAVAAAALRVLTRRDPRTSQP